MKSINKSAVAVVVFGSLFAGLMGNAHAAPVTMTIAQYDAYLQHARIAANQAMDLKHAIDAGTVKTDNAGRHWALDNVLATGAEVDRIQHMQVIFAPEPPKTVIKAPVAVPPITPTKQPQAIPQPKQLVPQPLPQPTKQPQATPPKVPQPLVAPSKALVVNVPLKQYPQTNTPVSTPLVAVQTFPTTTITNPPVTAPTGVVVINGADGKDGNNGATGKKGAQGVAGVAGANGKNGSNGLNGRNGANGVTTIITKHEVDQTTKNNVASNRNAISSNRSAINAMNQQTNSQFKSLKSEVDDNRKQANAGISGAMAMAGLPQVQTNQRVMFAAGGATYNGESAVAVGASVNFNDHVVGKVSFSDDTSNNMGASVGVGIGF